MVNRVLRRHWLSISCFLGVIYATVAKGELLVGVEAVDVLPGGLPKTGYWHKEYDGRCGADLFEAHGANAGMSFTFVGSGFVARLLSCETCSPVEIRIDDSKEPITVDLSNRGFRCPTGSPVFTKTDLGHGKHTIYIKRLEEGKPMKVLKFEYLTHEPPTSSPGESEESSSPPHLPDSPQITFSAATATSVPEDIIAATAGKAASSIASSAMKSVAKVVAKQAAGIAMSYVVMTGAKLVAKAAMGSLRDIGVATARRAIDSEIAKTTVLDEPSIPNLKPYNTTSILPSEILSQIFLVAKDGSPPEGTPKEGSWLNVAGVCREWRKIALASPRLWSTIDLSKPECALEFFKRSKAAPLWIHCNPRPLDIVTANGDMVKSIMADIGRIQEIDVYATTQEAIVQFLAFNTAARAPLLECLRLVVSREWSSTTVPFPLDVMYREMPSLRRLDLHKINISEFPPLPHLTHLTISLNDWSTMRPTSLLASLHHSLKLEELDITGLMKDKPGASPPRIKLPNLTLIAIKSFDFETSTIFDNIEYPSSSAVVFSNIKSPSGAPDLSSLVRLCGRFLEEGAPAAQRISFMSSKLVVSCQGPPISELLSIRLHMGYGNWSAAFIPFTSALPLESVLDLEIGEFSESDVTDAQWRTIFQRCKALEILRLRNQAPLSLFEGFVRLPLPEPPHLAPGLQAIFLQECIIIESEFRDLYPDESYPFNILERFLGQRKRAKLPVKDVYIEMCEITREAVERLKQHTNIIWDGLHPDDLWGEDEEDEDEEDEEDEDEEEEEEEEVEEEEEEEEEEEGNYDQDGSDDD
ncbi:hypothetical protein EYR36_011597 [Pleurotus pulmonarius]|nr:hypothetical protein EYR36_011597 [Pleurotus pulmonarius]